MLIFFTILPSKAILLLSMLFYKPREVNKSALHSLARQTFGCEPFDWQRQTTLANLEGCDGILGKGIVSGKAIFFTMASVMIKCNIIIIVSPLSGLMIEQTENVPI